MTKIKLCGLSRPCDIEAANELKPEYIGFVFARESGRYVTPRRAAELKKMLSPEILAVGVFVREREEAVAELLEQGIIDLAQLHGGEPESYVERLRLLTSKKIIKAFRVGSEQDILHARDSAADYVLLDSGSGGTGAGFPWELAKELHRPYFLAGGLDVQNVGRAVALLHPHGVDVSSGIETGGRKDGNKMAEFVAAVRKEGEKK